jgi:hypothetical protein
MLLLGAISLIASIGYNSSALAFIGLGLVFWGAILFYIRPEEYTKSALFEAALSPPLTTLYHAILELGYKGWATYLPPKYFANQEATKVYISKYKRSKLPTPETVQLIENQLMARTMQDILVTRPGMLVTPPGIELSKLFEKSLRSSFVEIGLQKLLLDLPKLFIESLEIAQNLELREENDMTPKEETPKEETPKEETPKEDGSASSTKMNSERARKKRNVIRARITRPIFGIKSGEVEEPSQILSSISCPVCSALAIAITEGSGKPVRIIDIRRSEEGSILEVNYEILGK